MPLWETSCVHFLSPSTSLSLQADSTQCWMLCQIFILRLKSLVSRENWTRLRPLDGIPGSALDRQWCHLFSFSQTLAFASINSDNMVSNSPACRHRQHLPSRPESHEPIPNWDFTVSLTNAHLHMAFSLRKEQQAFNHISCSPELWIQQTHLLISHSPCRNSGLPGVNTKHSF